MSTELATGYVNVVPSARGFGRALERQVSGVGTSIGGRIGTDMGQSITSKAGGLLAGFATRGSLALGGLAVAGAGIGISLAGDFQQTTVAFEGLLGSAEAASSMLGELREFAKTTPFEFPELADSARRLLGVGFAAEDVIPAMTDIGNVAATLGVGEAEIQGVVRALGQMKGKGKTSAEELQQISEQLPGFSAVEAIAASLGVTTAEAFKLMEDGAVSGQVGVDAILDGMRQFPGAAGAMDRQSKTLNGALSTLKDTASTAAIDFITPYLPAITKGVQSLGSGLTSVFGWLTDTGVPAARDAIAEFTAGWSGASDGGALGTFGETVRGVWTFITDVAVPGIQGAVSDLMAGLRGEEGDTAFSNIGTVIATLIGYLRDDLVPIIQNQVVPALTSIGDFVAEHGPPLLDTITGLVERFVELKPAVIGVSGALVAMKVGPGVVSGISGVTSGIGSLVTGARGLASVPGVINGIAQTRGISRASAVWNVLSTSMAGTRLAAIRTTAATVAQRVATVASSVATRAAAAGQWLLNAAMSANPVGLVVAAIVALVAAAVLAYQKVDWFRTAVDAMGRALRDAALWVWDKGLKPAFEALVWYVTTLVIPTWTRIFNVARTALTGIVTAVTWFWNSVLRPIFSLLVAYFTNFVIPTWTRIFTVARTVFNGIATAVSWFWNTVVGPIFRLVIAYITGVLIPGWQRIFTVARTVFTGVVNAVQGFWSTASSIFSLVVTKAQEMWAGVSSRFEDFKAGVTALKDLIQEKIDAAILVFIAVKDRIGDAMEGVADTIKSPFTTAFDAVKSLWNSTIGGFAFTVPTWVPVVGGRSFSIPTMHTGGVVPGGAGDEVLRMLEGGEVVLSRRHVAALHSQINATPAGDGQPPLDVHVHLDATELTSQLYTPMARLSDQRRRGRAA